MKYEYQNCPLCGKENTKFYYVDHLNRKYFRCDICTDFQLYVGAEERLKSSPKDFRENLSQESHDSPHEKVLYITLRLPTEDHNEVEVYGEFHDRATLPS